MVVENVSSPLLSVLGVCTATGPHSDLKTPAVQPTMYVIAGSNGAGKSTFASRARDLLGVNPIDADAIQRQNDLSSSAAWAEGLRRCREAIANRQSFLVETTLAGSDRTRPPTYLALMHEARARHGYVIDLTFIALENADAHVARVADRVAAGLHDIPESTIRMRYERTIWRLPDAIRASDHALLIDNSSVAVPFRPVAEFQSGRWTALSRDMPGWARFTLVALRDRYGIERDID